MRKSFILEGGNFGYVKSFYKDKKWINVEDYNIREKKNEPPIIVLANGKKKNQFSYNADCRTEGFYDWCNIMSDYCIEDGVSFEDLKYVAKQLNINSKFNRMVYNFLSGKTIKPALVTDANNFIIREYHNVKDIIGMLESHGAKNIYIFGQHNILFDFEVPE